jgi:hypothetical protein
MLQERTGHRLAILGCLDERLVAPMRFELMASGLGILRSILLSYGVRRRLDSKTGGQ